MIIAVSKLLRGLILLIKFSFIAFKRVGEQILRLREEDEWVFLINKF